MNEILVPDWIKSRQAALALQEAQEEAKKQRQIADSLRIQKDAPNFYDQLLKELARNTDALHLINFQGNTVVLPSLSGESACRVFVAIPGSFPSRTYTDVRLFPNRQEIRCTPLDGGVHRYFFCVVNEGVEVFPERSDSEGTFSAEELAKEIVERMVEHLSN